MPIDPTLGASIHQKGHSSQTEIVVEHVKHEWTVKNFSHCYQGNNEDKKDYIFLAVNRVVQGKLPKIGYKARLSLKSAENKEIYIQISNPSQCDYGGYIRRDVLLPQILPLDSFTVVVEIDVATEFFTTTSPHPLNSLYSERRMADDYTKLFRKGILTDLTIRVGDKEVRTHRAVLAARSPYFRDLLTREETNESKTGIMTITGMDADVVIEMLSYVYSGRCSKEIGEMALDNVCQLLVLSDMCRAHKLREYSLTFLAQHTKIVAETPGWKETLKSHPDLVTDIVNGFDKSGSGPTSSRSSCAANP